MLGVQCVVQELWFKVLRRILYTVDMFMSDIYCIKKIQVNYINLGVNNNAYLEVGYTMSQHHYNLYICFYLKLNLNHKVIIFFLNFEIIILIVISFFFLLNL